MCETNLGGVWTEELGEYSICADSRDTLKSMKLIYCGYAGLGGLVLAAPALLTGSPFSLVIPLFLLGVLYVLLILCALHSISTKKHKIILLVVLGVIALPLMIIEYGISGRLGFLGIALRTAIPFLTILGGTTIIVYKPEHIGGRALAVFTVLIVLVGIWFYFFRSVMASAYREMCETNLGGVWIAETGECDIPSERKIINSLAFSLFETEVDGHLWHFDGYEVNFKQPLSSNETDIIVSARFSSNGAPAGRGIFDLTQLQIFNDTLFVVPMKTVDISGREQLFLVSVNVKEKKDVLLLSQFARNAVARNVADSVFVAQESEIVNLWVDGEMLTVEVVGNEREDITTHTFSVTSEGIMAAVSTE